MMARSFIPYKQQGWWIIVIIIIIIIIIIINYDYYLFSGHDTENGDTAKGGKSGPSPKRRKYSALYITELQMF